MSKLWLIASLPFMILAALIQLIDGEATDGPAKKAQVLAWLATLVGNLPLPAMVLPVVQVAEQFLAPPLVDLLVAQGQKLGHLGNSPPPPAPPAS